jgi:ABC-type nitrate/sulfonate/bicarbonate transport system substrate-binding protein
MLGRTIAVTLGLSLSASAACAADPVLLHVNTFPTARALPFFVARDRGFFAKHGLKVDLQFTKGSKAQRQALADGSADIVQAAVDNAVAMIDVAKVDVVIVGGGDSGTNEFYVQDYVKKFSDIRGHAIVVDATNTAYALQAKKILLQHGLTDGKDYTLDPVGNGVRRLKALFADKNNAGAILNLPFSLEAAAKGMHSLGRTTDMLGPYQAGGTFVRRAWAQQHAQILEQYLAAYIEALRWSLDPKHRAADAAILEQNYKLPPDIAEKCIALMAEPGFGFARDAKFNLQGFKNVLALRAEVEGGKPADPQRYINLSYYDQALKLVHDKE